MTNQVRRLRAQYALMKYREIRGAAGTTESDITDLIADLLHYAHAEDIDTESTLETAAVHYQAEVKAHDDD